MAAPILSGIYAIRNRTTGGVYIGSAVHVVLRWRHHRKVLRRGTHHSRYLQRVWNKYGEHNFDFIVVEDVEDHASLVDREQHWIDTHRVGGELYNVCPTAGSTLGRKHSDLTKTKMRAIKSTPEEREANRVRQLGRVRSAETKAKHRATVDTPEYRMRLSSTIKGRKATPASIESNRLGQTGRKHSEATKAKIRLHGLGKRHTAESRLKISLMKTGKKLGPQSPEHSRKIQAARVGTHLSEATKAKIRLKARQRGPMTAETKAKISAYHKGRIKTPEHIAKINASKRANLAARSINYSLV